MIIKPRGENIELELFHSLRVHKKLEVEDENNFAYLEKGWLGEKQFDLLLLGLPNECLILNNLLLKVNNSLFQIDSLLITQKKIYIFEIKNNEGDYFFKNDRLYMFTGKEIKNPLNQISRSESLFRQLLQDLRFNSIVESQVVFINPEFFLYEAPVKTQFVFHAQLGRFLKKLEITAASKVSADHIRFAEKLASMHITENPYSRLPIYTFEELEKGIACGRGCGCLDLEDTNRHTLICKKCKFIEDKESAILRSVGEFSFLFPEKRITLDVIYTWCKVIKSKRTIQKILSKNYDLVLLGRGSYYVEKEKK
ncbi:nuclease-related domain-containing protein [Fredinandcohnia sp. QZ13]|uniref:nuclease-related domain-containing protein n=1 Tax=Fredinandcohnia sp. QZ13 TaxID=3073144 RepID=UPI00285351C2|nr:nuclease-related domain-containing protein [Fredinandcohnia sp. QZ13]MDR4887400.1 nuclease-related domain-containing protein [Fredinandcohnia sp. QZ13]